jgi:hypothetical protein
MSKRILIAGISIFIFVQLAYTDEAAQEVVGSVSRIIVYRGQALVTRTIELEFPRGSSQVVVQELPNAIISESLYAQALGGVTVTSVRYRERAVEEDTREEVKRLDAEIEKVQAGLRHICSASKLCGYRPESGLKPRCTAV